MQAHNLNTVILLGHLNPNGDVAGYKRKIYQITELGEEVLELELKRINRLYHNAQEVAPWKR